MSFLFGVFQKNKSLGKFKFSRNLCLVALLILLVFSFSYTQRNNWEKLRLESTICKGYSIPSPPANNYLNPADLELFEGIRNKNFLSYGWKGLVIGVATENYPLHSKGATITVIFFDFERFTRETCANKLLLAKENNIEYVYLDEINCDGFELIGISIEDLYLYKVNSFVKS